MNKKQITFDSKKQFAILMSTIVVFVSLYLYFLNLSVLHVVMRKEAIQDQNNIRAEISLLETKYIESQHEIAARISTLDGYNSEATKIFVSRATANSLVRAN